MKDKKPEERTVEVRWSDDWLLAVTDELVVLNKPSGLPLLADRSGETDLWTLAKERFPGLKLVHRIDKGTSGVLLFARSAATQATLTRAFNERSVRKRYLARSWGSFPTGSFWLDLPLRPGRKSRYRVAAPRETIRQKGRRFCCTPDDGKAYAALTQVRKLAEQDNESLLMLRPHTGRRHQLRVQLAWIGHPILGDALYGKPAAAVAAAERLCLHASAVAVPGFGRFSAPTPDRWINAWPEALS